MNSDEEDGDPPRKIIKMDSSKKSKDKIPTEFKNQRQSGDSSNTSVESKMKKYGLRKEEVFVLSSGKLFTHPFLTNVSLFLYYYFRCCVI